MVATKKNQIFGSGQFVRNASPDRKYICAGNGGASTAAFNTWDVKKKGAV